MGDPLEFINIYSVANYQKMKGDSLIQRKKFEKSLIVEKTSKLKTLGALKSYPSYLLAVMDVVFILVEALTYPVCFGHA